MTNKLTLELEVVDSGRIKVKQFADESKRAIAELERSTRDLGSASANLQVQYQKLISTVATNKLFEDLAGSIKSTEAASAAFVTRFLKFIYDLARGASSMYGLYKAFEELRDTFAAMEEAVKSTRQFGEELKKIGERLGRLRAPEKVLAFIQEEQMAARELAQKLNTIYELQDKIKILRETIDQRRAEGLPVLKEREDLREYSGNLKEAILEISALYGSLENAEGKLAEHNSNIVEAAMVYDDLSYGVKGAALSFDELGKAIDKAQPDKEAFERIRRAWEEAESKAAEATIELARAQAEHNWQVEQYINAFKERQTLKEIEHMVLLAETTGEAAAAYRGIEENLNRLNQKSRESINIFASMFDALGALSNLMSQLGISIGGGVQRFLGIFSSIRQLTQSIGQIRQVGAGGILEFLGLRGRGQGGVAAPSGGIAGFFSSLAPGLMGGGIGGLLSRSLFADLSTPMRTGLGAGMGALGGGMASWMLGGSFFGPIGLAVGGIIGGLMSLFGGGRQRPPTRAVAAAEGAGFADLFGDRFYAPAAAQLRQFLAHSAFTSPDTFFTGRGRVFLGPAGEQFASTLETGQLDIASARNFLTSLRALQAAMRSTNVDEMSENSRKLVETINQMADAIGGALGESQQQLEGVMQNLIGLERQITGAILQMRPPTIAARIGAFGSTMDALRAAWANPDLQPAEREQLLRRAFEQTTQSAGDLVAELQNMARENQVAARTIEGLSRDIYNLRREEEERRRGVGRAIFEAGLVGRVTPDEANRLRRQYLMEEALRIRTVLESGQVTGAERIQTAEQGQSIAEEILRLYGQDELVSLEELANVQRDVITALQFIDQQIATGYQEQVQPLQDQLTTQRDILTVNQAMLQANFGVQTAAEAIEAIQNTAVGYLEAIRDQTIRFGASIAEQLAPLLGTDSPMYHELALQNAFVQVGNSLIQSGFENLRRPTDAIQAEMAALPANTASMIASMLSNVQVGAIHELPLQQPLKSAYEMLSDIAAGGSNLTSSDIMNMLAASGVQILQHGGRVARTGIAVVEEGETVVPAGAPAGGGLAQEINLELHLHQTIDGASEETVIRRVIPIIYRESRDGRDVVHVNGMVNV